MDKREFEFGLQCDYDSARDRVHKFYMITFVYSRRIKTVILISTNINEEN